MNRAFKRLMQGGILNTSDTMIKFTFEGKTYMSLGGDTIKVALLANNITNYNRSELGYFVSSASGLYPMITNITDNNACNHTVVADDFKITDGMKLSQTNKSNIKSKLRSVVRFFKTSTGIKSPINPIKAKDLTYSLIDKTLMRKEVVKFTEKMNFNTEKSYTHTDVAIIGTNIFALQAALILADSGLRIVICDNQKDNPYHLFQESTLKALFSDLQKRAYQHKNITLKRMTDLSLVHDTDNSGKTAKIMGINHNYCYDATATLEHKQQHSLELLVVNAYRILYAPTPQETGFLFQGHHLHAVMACREFMDLYIKFGLIPNHNIVLYVANDMAYDVLSVAGIIPDKVNAIIDTRPVMTQTMIEAEKKGFKIYAGYVVTHATGKDTVQNVTFKSLRGDKDSIIKSVSCDLMLCSSGYELDISLFDKTPNALDIHANDNHRISITVNPEFLKRNHISLLGYAMHNIKDTHTNRQTVLDICKDILQEYNVTTELHENFELTKIINNISWHQPEFYDAHDLCRKDTLFFPQDIYYQDFIQILYRYDNPLNVIDALKQHNNFYGNHRAIRILMTQMQKIYNMPTHDIVTYYGNILKALTNNHNILQSHTIFNSISTCGQPKPHIMPCLDNTKMDMKYEIITPDSNMSSIDIDRYYHKIKNYVGIRAFNQCNIIDISGADVATFMKHIINDIDQSVIFPDLNIGEHFIFSEKNSPHFITMMHYAYNRYTVIMPSESEFKKNCDALYVQNKDLEIVVNHIHQNWAYLQLIGQQSLDVFAKMIKQPIPTQTTNLWIENIELRFIVHKRFGMHHIEILVISDAACSFYEKITQDIFQVLPFGQNIYNMFALEAGVIFDMSLNSEDTDTTTDTLFKTQVLAMPLVKLDTPLSGGDIYQDKYHLDEAPLGMTCATMIYSPSYNQYVFPTLLKGDFKQWENKILSVVSKDGSHITQVKIISDKMLKIQEVA